MAVRLLFRSKDICSGEELEQAFEMWWSEKDRRRKLTAESAIKRARVPNALTKDADLEDNDSCDEYFVPSSDEEDFSDRSLVSENSDADDEPLRVKGADWGDNETEDPEDDLSDGWSTNSEEP